MSSDNQRTLLSKAFEILLRYYDLAGALRCLKQRCVINSGELQAISKQPDAEDKVEMLKTVLSEDPTRTGAFISAMIAFSEEGKAELQYLLSEVESGTRNSINLGSLMEFLPSAGVEGEPDAPYTRSPRIPQRSSSSVSQDSGITAAEEQLNMRRRNSGPVYHISGPVDIHHHYHFHSCSELDNELPAFQERMFGVPDLQTNSQSDAQQFPPETSRPAQMRHIRRWHTYSTGETFRQQRRSINAESPEDIQAMRQAGILRRYTPLMMKYMNTRSVLPYLRANGLITDEDWDFLINLNRTERERVHYVLSIVPRSGPSAFQKFMLSLSQDTDHKAHQELAKTLERAMLLLEEDPLRIGQEEIPRERQMKQLGVHSSAALPHTSTASPHNHTQTDEPTTTPQEVKVAQGEESLWQEGLSTSCRAPTEDMHWASAQY